MALGSSSTILPESAFHGIGHPPASPSTTLEKCPYDVFINHHGKDVKLTLASSIYHFLGGIGINVFLDQKELVLGDLFPKEIEDVMRSAQIHIAIFSRNYASSPWCLEELSFMLEIRATIIPVFYDVQPADLRWVDAQEIYAQPFQEYEAKGRYLPETIKKWKKALHEVSYINGGILNTNGDLGLLLKKITERIQQEIKNVKVPFQVARYPVGLDDAVKGFDDTIGGSAQGHQNVQIVVIVGMSGSGKTTLARELYNRKYKAFYRCSFLSEVREANLTELQKELLKDLAHLENVPYKDASQLKSFLAGRFKNLSGPVLIVLDDVDDFNQLDNLLPDEGRRLGSGSLIIVTTCSLDICRWRGISSVYKMKTLDPRLAEELFCRHAFLLPSPPDGFKGLVQEFINACDGLPLSIEVIAEMLKEKPEDEWISILEKMSRLLPRKIIERLKLAYDALDEEEQNVFLDVACFFVGEKKNLAIAVWNATSWRGFGTLVNNCLVEIDKQNRIRMHNHLRDMGRQIAIRCLPLRLWSPQQIAVIKRKMISIQNGNHIRGIKIVPTEIGELSSYEEECMANIREEILSLAPSLAGLELLVTKGDYLYHVIGEVSRELLWLRWFQIGQIKLPARLSLKHLRVLELFEDSGREHQLEQLWEADSDPPLQLRELVISDCHKFQRFPNSIGCLLHLKRIVIKNGNNVSSLPEEFCGLESLEHLQLCGSVMLVSLPSNFGALRSLRYLDLSRCRNLRRLPVSFQHLMLLEYLNLQECGQLTLMPEDFQDMTKLEFLSLSGCEQVEELPLQITDQASLRELYLNGMKRLRELPINIGQLSRLQKMSIGSDLLTSLPSSVGDLQSLSNLSIEYCTKLESLPEEFCRLQLEHLQLCDCVTLVSLPSNFGDLGSLRYLDLSRCKNLRRLPVSFQYLMLLEYLNLQECGQLMLMPEDFKNMTNLEFLRLSWCEQFEEFPCHITDLVSLRELCLNNMKRLRELPVNIGQLSRLEKMSIGSDLLTSLPEGLGDLKSLANLSIEYCINLESLPTSMGCLSSLTNLSIEYCTKLESLPTSMGDLSSLIHLSIEYCPNLQSLPTSIGNLPSLTNLSISYCSNLKSLPTSMGCLSSLTNFSIEYCVRLKFLPTSLGDLSSLNDLSIVSCSSLKYLPTSMKNLSSLKNLSVKYCSNLESLPTSLGDLSSLTDLSIACCSNLKSLPTSLADLRSLTRLSISECRKLTWLPFSESCFEWLEDLAIEKCPISHVDFGAALSSFALSNLKQMSLKETEVHRISFSGDRYPRLESLSLYNNHNLTEIEELPTGVKIVLE